MPEWVWFVATFCAGVLLGWGAAVLGQWLAARDVIALMRAEELRPEQPGAVVLRMHGQNATGTTDADRLAAERAVRRIRW